MPEKSITVRPAEPGDLAFVGRDGHLSAEINLRKINLGEVFLLLAGAEPAGYLKLEYLWSSVPYISLIRIEPRHRGQGYSHALLGFVEEYLRNQGHTALYSSSQVDEPTPQAWHRHMGFTDCGIINGINAGDVGEVFFRKQL